MFFALLTIKTDKERTSDCSGEFSFESSAEDSTFHLSNDSSMAERVHKRKYEENKYEETPSEIFGLSKDDRELERIDIGNSSLDIHGGNETANSHDSLQLETEEVLAQNVLGSFETKTDSHKYVHLVSGNHEMPLQMSDLEVSSCPTLIS